MMRRMRRNDFRLPALMLSKRGFKEGGDKMKKILLFICFFFSITSANAAQMQVTRLQLGSGTTSSYVGFPYSTGSMPITTKAAGASGDSNDVATGTDLFFPPGILTQGNVNLYGDTGTSGFGGMFLIDISDGDPTDGTRVTNAVTGFFGSTSSPFDTAAADLSNNNIPAGTSVIVTIDMGGQIPHYIFVQGGSTTVNYNSSGNGTLVITSSTVGFTNQANQTINSGFGFFIVTNQVLDLTSYIGSNALLFTGWTNVWVGDMDFAFPGVSGRSSGSLQGDFGSSFGSALTRIGGSFYGKSGDTASISFWLPSSSINAILGTSDPNSIVINWKDSSASTSRASKDMTYNGSNLSGTTYTGTFTFASGGNGGVGQGGNSASNVAVAVPTMTEWGMIIFMLLAGFSSIYYLRRRRA